MELDPPDTEAGDRSAWLRVRRYCSVSDPAQACDRVKTNRRDTEKLALLFRADRRFRMLIATSNFRVLRRSLESALNSAVGMMHEAPHEGLNPASDGNNSRGNASEPAHSVDVEFALRQAGRHLFDDFEDPASPRALLRR
ncbi:hypothetical protein [Mesorhizobium sp. LNHC252B00]|uniref:hypothetical protein n=1 Tax=Mesorhizobium sp. LNHC252B00 TaxID=1287252 RepID=UPI0012ECB0EA|nr:hypothetical protein [Mesorhizobium sp. LNHC252B00]